MAPALTSPPLQIESLVKRFGQVTAVDGITLHVQPGECFGLLGPNGAGKTTLIRAIAGRVVPDSGSVSVFGAPADSTDARIALGWAPQELALYRRLTCRENLESFGRFHGMARAALQPAIAWCLRWAALEDRASEPVMNLSGGMKRRLNLAAALIHRPRLVLMDEPTAGVDPQSRNRIFEMIENLRGEGMSIVYTTHYMEEAERLCGRIAIVDRGRIVALGSREQLIHQAFASRSQVLARFAGPAETIAAWVARSEGRYAGGLAQFTVEHPTEIVGLLQAAAQAGLDLTDVALSKPNLESVFLHLTGRELRD